MKKKLGALLEHLQSSYFIGLILTLFFAWLAHDYYLKKDTISAENTKGTLYKIITTIDNKILDLKFFLRGYQTPDEKVAVIAVDDESINQIGRWPWSREKMAELIENLMKYSPKALGFDIVFSEPQVDQLEKTLGTLLTDEELAKNDIKGVWRERLNKIKGESKPDDILAKTLETHQDKLVMGAFFEDTRMQLNYPFQSICLDELFKLSPAYKSIENQAWPPFVFDANLKDVDLMSQVDFTKAFEPIFKVLNEHYEKKILKENFSKESVSQLDDFQFKALMMAKSDELLNYCTKWLTDQDPYLSYWQKNWNQVFAPTPILQKPFNEARALLDSLNFNSPILQFNELTTNFPLLVEKSIHTSSFNAVQENDGSIRRSNLLFRIGRQYLPSLALQTYLVSSGLQAHFTLDRHPKHPDQYKVIDLVLKDPETDEVKAKVPVNNRGQMLINYRGPEKSYAYVPAHQLFSKGDTMKIQRFKKEVPANKYREVIETVSKEEFIKDRLFIIGATAVGVYDLRVTPFQENYPGVETHATALGNLASRDFIFNHPKEHEWMLLAIVVIGVILSVSIHYLSALPGFFLTGTLLMGIYFTDWYFLFNKGIIASTVLAMFSALTVFTLMTAYKYFTEERKKKHFRATFSKYISPAIVDEILKDPDNINLGGKKQRMSVMFSDVRGFTTISEKLEPEVLSDVLNAYLTPMTNIVFANKGTLDKYMGDAIMAFFGAPIQFPDHARHACRCALASIDKLFELQKEFKAKGLPEIDIGIGINSGDMSVGNMGSDIVRSYTVMGDSVNLASRLEGINKEYGTRIIISEFTYEDVKDSFTAREVDWVRVKGKLQPIKIFELIAEGPVSGLKSELLLRYQSGYTLYRERKFKEALDLFNEALNVDPSDPVSQLYVERSLEYINNPPPNDWDGVYVMKTK